MNYSVSHYALSLKEALKGKSEKESREILKRFLLILRRNHASSRLARILQKYEYAVLKESGLSKVRVESPTPLQPDVRRELNKVIGKKVLVQEETRPELLGGLKILINDEVLIDASASHQLKKLFARKSG